MQLITHTRAKLVKAPPLVPARDSTFKETFRANSNNCPRLSSGSGHRPHIGCLRPRLFWVHECVRVHLKGQDGWRGRATELEFAQLFFLVWINIFPCATQAPTRTACSYRVLRTKRSCERASKSIATTGSGFSSSIG